MTRYRTLRLVLLALGLAAVAGGCSSNARKEKFAYVERPVETLYADAARARERKRYDEAIDLLENNYFYRWEGGEEVRQYYEDAYYLRGLDRFRQGKCELALADFQAALVYPENLEEGRPEFNESFARSYYYLGLAHEECGKKNIAKQYFRKAAEEDAGNSEYLYYNYLASVEL